MTKMKLYTHEEMLDRVLGKSGTPERNEYETQMNSFLMGEAIKKPGCQSTLPKNNSAR